MFGLLFDIYTWLHPGFLVGICVAYLFSFQCCVLFVLVWCLMCPWLSASLDCSFLIAPSFIYICYVYATKQNFIEKTNKQEIDCYYFMYLLDNYRCSM